MKDLGYLESGHLLPDDEQPAPPVGPKSTCPRVQLWCRGQIHYTSQCQPKALSGGDDRLWAQANLRHVVGTGPWGSVLDVVVTWHVLCGHHYLVAWFSRQEKRGSQPGHAGSVLICQFQNKPRPV